MLNVFEEYENRFTTQQHSVEEWDKFKQLKMECKTMKPSNIAKMSAASSPKVVQNPSVSEVVDISKMSQEEKDAKIVEMKKVVDAFHKLWYPLQLTTWMGIELEKCPLDLFMYQEILYECKPDLIIECGTYKGGSALFLAHLCDILNHGQVLTIDINQWVGSPLHPRISYLPGSSVDPKTLRVVENYVGGFRRVMVILDSDHTKEHVLKELGLYHKFVTSGQYLIVEDTNIHGHPVRDDLPAGPWEAVQEFLDDKTAGEMFKIDPNCERFLMTLNPSGYLRRVK